MPAGGAIVRRSVRGHAFGSEQRVPGKRFLILAAIAASCFAVLLGLQSAGPHSYVAASNAVQDAVARAGRRTPANADLVFLAIDSASVGLQEQGDIDELYGLGASRTEETRALRLMSSAWPWPREVYALVLERLLKAGAKVVLFDLTFPTATPGDEPFRLALDHYRDHVVIGSNFVSTTASDGSRFPMHTRPSETLVRETVPMDDRVAFTNFWPDDDEVVRRAQFRVALDQLQRGLSDSAAEQFLSLAARGMTKAGAGDGVPPGAEPRLFRFTAPPRQGFPPHSLFEIFVPQYWESNYGSGEFFRGKTVLIGAEGNWQHDEHDTPFGLMPGPELHLNAFNAAIHGEFIEELSPLAVALAILSAAILAVALSLFVRSPWFRLALLVAVDAAIGGLTLFAFNRLSLFTPTLPVLAQLNVTVLLGLVCDFAWERLEKNRVRRTLERYVSSNVVRELLDRGDDFQQSLGGVMKPAAILFSDIRGYSTVSARTNPQVLVAQLNEYLGAMVDCVFRHGGTLDKFIGDAVMAVWGNVQTAGLRNDAANAVRAALAMREELRRLNREWKSRGLPELRIGIAVNHGDVVVGNIGSPQRMEFTVIGDAVNVSWKLQELTKDLGCDLAVTAAMAPLLVEDFELQPLGSRLLQGQSEPTEIFAVVGAVEVSSERARLVSRA
jgi:adenylate cyclase